MTVCVAALRAPLLAIALAVAPALAAAQAAGSNGWVTLQRVGGAQPETVSVLRNLPEQRTRDRMPVLVEVKWSYKALPDGMPAPDQLGLAQRLDDGVAKIFGAQGMHVITRTGEGIRATTYYVDNPDRHAGAIKALFDGLPALSVQVRARDEPEWETVRELREAVR